MKIQRKIIVLLQFLVFLMFSHEMLGFDQAKKSQPPSPHRASKMTIIDHRICGFWGQANRASVIFTDFGVISGSFQG
jgi:hypothetical protein